MEKLKNNLILLETSAINSLSTAKEEVLNPSKKTKLFVVLGLFAFILLATTSLTFAAGGGDLFGTIQEKIQDIYSKILGITTGICVLCVVIGLLCAQLTTNQQKTAKWIDFVKKAVIIWIIINSLFFLFNFISDLTKNGKIDKIPTN